MNLLISEAIKRKTHATLKYVTDPVTAATTYHVRKGELVAAVEVSAEYAAANNPDAIASHVAVEAHKQLAAQRDQGKTSSKGKADVKEPVATGTTPSEATGTTDPAKLAGPAGDDGCAGCSR